MDNINLHILTPNKNKKRYFGVDYFMNILTGSNPLFMYYSTSLDFNPVYKSGPIAYLEEIYDFLESELKTKPKGSIIGIGNNPDIYSGIDSISRILDLLEKYEMGLALETSSTKVFTDCKKLSDFGEKLPLIVVVPCSTIELESKLLDNALHLDNAINIITKLKSYDIYSGMVYKPIIPGINDNPTEFLEIIKQAIAAKVDFIYPALSLKFDSKKIRAFYDIIDVEFPENMILYHELYGYRTSWESENLAELKKYFVINCKKNKVLYSMKEIINHYKPDEFVQLKLF